MAAYEVEVRISPSDDGGYRAQAVGLHGCWTIADTIGQAIEDMREVVHLWVEASREHNMPMPPGLADAKDISIKVVVPVAAG